MTTFMAIVSIIYGILNIILFSKVWVMCDDVKRLTHHFCGSEDNNILAIDIASGKDARKALVSKLKSIAQKAQGLVIEDYIRIYGTEPNSEIRNTMEKYKKIYKNLGETFPEDLAKIKSLEDLWDMFD